MVAAAADEGYMIHQFDGDGLHVEISMPNIHFLVSGVANAQLPHVIISEHP
ncbi:hypothetical protein D1872_291820 [compost metagenome]